ncbi:hypothetical protein R1sor_025978 [Riccia sorocarpa]|uniref:Uncharacterized protein n=1 Tax=Riccia sorocarpa TaxID=122646 RepID=A0ABD3GDE4_9MARC
MALYSDRDSPKKAAAGFGQRWTGRRASVKKTTLLWVLVALLSLLMLKVVFYDSSSLTVSTPEKREELIKERELPSLDLPSTGHKEKVIHPGSDSASDTSGSGRVPPASPKKKSKLSSIDKPPASPEAKSLHPPKSPPPKVKKLLPPVLTSEEEDEEFDLPEDNDKEEAKNWQAPPVKKIEGVEQVTSISNSSASSPAVRVGIVEH